MCARVPQEPGRSHRLRTSSRYRQAKETKCGGRDDEASERLVVCAGQRTDQEGSSPSGARMRSAVSERGGNASRAGGEQVWRSLHGHEGESRTRPRWTCSQLSQHSGGQGAHREVGSEGHEEKYRAVVDGGYPRDEPVGQRWDKVEPALWGRRRSHSPTVPRCMRTARYRRSERDPRRTRWVLGWHREKRPYKRERSGKQCSSSRRTAG